MAKSAKSDKRECFVVGAIGDTDSATRIHADWLLEEIIQPVFVEDRLADFVILRADKIATPGLIDAQIIDKLLTVDLVIADLTFLNPNAFYEIGIRHVAQKPIIHMNLSSERLPFDVSLFRSIKFSIEQPSHLKAARRQLKDAVEAVLADDYEVENPVTKARGRVRFEETATPVERLVRTELADLGQRMEALEQGMMPRASRRGTKWTVPARQAVPEKYLSVEEGGSFGHETMTFGIDHPDASNVLQDFVDEVVEPLIGPHKYQARVADSNLSLEMPIASVSTELKRYLEQEANGRGIVLIPF